MGLMRLLPRPATRTEPAAEPEPEPTVEQPAEPMLTAVPEPDARPDVEGRPVTRVIALANQKGGVAKTTTTLNLGVAFREQGYSVLVIDLDPQGNLTMSQDEPGCDRALDVRRTRAPDSDLRRDRAARGRHRRRVDRPRGAELALSSMIGRERALEKALVEVRDRYDFIMIDTPPSLGLLTINAFVAATGVIVPVQCEYLSLRGLVQLENTLAMVRENLNPHVGVEGIVATMYDGRTLHSRRRSRSSRRTSVTSSSGRASARRSAMPRRP